jgi:DNA (cytosine-5)-methyltransferase 1
MEDAALDQAPVWSDVTTFDSSKWRGKVDCLIAGYPCQGESLAGLRKGTSDPRFIFPHIAGHIENARIPIVFCENVGAHLSGSFHVVARYMQDMGFTLAAGLFTAKEVGANHKRERLFWLAWNPGWMADTEHTEWRPRQPEGHVTNRDNAKRKEAAGGFRTSGETLGYTEGQLPRALPIGNEQEHSGHPDAGNGVVRDMEHAKRPRRPQTGPGPSQHTRQEPEPGSGELANPGCISPQVQAEGRQPAIKGIVCDSVPLAYPTSERRREAGRARSGPTQWAASAGPSLYYDGTPRFRPVSDPVGEYGANHLPLFAPGPSDHRAWLAALESAPILEPAVRRMAYGRSTRMDRLRLTGNGVSPLAAAYAYCTLRNALTAHFAAKRANEFTMMEAAE